jgi:hypothetical protein
LKLLKLYLKRYMLSCQLFLNNLATMRDYINFVFSCRQIYDLILNTQIINAQNLLRSGFGITHNYLIYTLQNFAVPMETTDRITLLKDKILQHIENSTMDISTELQIFEAI